MEYLKSVPFDEYLEIDAVSASELKHAIKSTSHYMRYKREGINTTPAMEFGTLVHTLILEPESFVDRYVIAPSGDKRKKDVKEAWKALEENKGDRAIVSQDDYECASELAESVFDHPFWQKVKHCDREVVSLWDRCKVNCKCRYDMLCDEFAVDIKTVSDASPNAFSRQCYSLGYHIQAAHYLNGHQNKDALFYFLCIEKVTGFVAVYQLSEMAIALGSRKIDEALEKIGQIDVLGVEPPYSTDPVLLDIPTYAYFAEEENG